MTARRVGLAALLVVGLGLVVSWSPLGPRPQDARKNRAQLQCRSLASVVEAASVRWEVWPPSLQDLLTPAFGCGSLLKNGPDDLNDPWGKPYQLRYVRGPDGTTIPLVHTTTSDGTPISQYGVGPLAHVP